jgi:molybdenum cofactor biosynthesis enzyme
MSYREHLDATRNAGPELSPVRRSKGDVLAVARIAAIQGAKRTCRPDSSCVIRSRLTEVCVDFAIDGETNSGALH